MTGINGLVILVYCLAVFVILPFSGVFVCLLLILGGVGLYYFRIEPLSPDRIQSVMMKTAEGETDGKTGHGECLLIGHRGCGVDAPENTLEAIREAKQGGADGVEIDLEFTRDGVPVLMHDGTVDRTTDGSGNIGSLDYDQVSKLNAAAKHPNRDKFTFCKIPTLDEGLQECLKLDLTVFIDCKSYRQPQKTADVIFKVFQEHPTLYDRAVVCSFWPNILYAVRKKDAKIITGLTHRHKNLTLKIDYTPRNEEVWKQWCAPVMDWILEWSHDTWLWYLCGNSFFLVHKASVSSNMMRLWQSRGICVIAWTVNNPLEKRHFLENLHCSIITDSMDPDYHHEQAV